MVDALIENPTFYKYTSFPLCKWYKQNDNYARDERKKITLWRYCLSKGYLLREGYSASASFFSVFSTTSTSL